MMYISVVYGHSACKWKIPSVYIGFSIDIFLFYFIACTSQFLVLAVDNRSKVNNAWWINNEITSVSLSNYMLSTPMESE